LKHFIAQDNILSETVHRRNKGCRRFQQYFCFHGYRIQRSPNPVFYCVLRIDAHHFTRYAVHINTNFLTQTSS